MQSLDGRAANSEPSQLSVKVMRGFGDFLLGVMDMGSCKHIFVLWLGWSPCTRWWRGYKRWREPYEEEILLILADRSTRKSTVLEVYLEMLLCLRASGFNCSNPWVKWLQHISVAYCRIGFPSSWQKVDKRLHRKDYSVWEDTLTTLTGISIGVRNISRLPWVTRHVDSKQCKSLVKIHW